MQKIILPRQAWKTSALIEISEKTGQYIVCSDRNRVFAIQQLAKKMWKNIPFPVTLDEIENIHWSSINRDGVLVDDLDQIVSMLIRKQFKWIWINFASMSEDKIIF